jgi:hypothetical protein
MRTCFRAFGNYEHKVLLLILALSPLRADERCAVCHPKEAEGYARSAMARALAPVGSGPLQPGGTFEHAPSKTTFFIRSAPGSMTQGFTRQGESAELPVAFVIGSGEHAFGFLFRIGDHIFQSPLSYYTSRHIWDVAPGYELDSHPDFTRPVTPECLFCHSGKPLPLDDSLNQYQAGVFAGYGIGCDRCHGDLDAHLKDPIRGSIVNPAKLSGATRASVCEQCHLTGEIRIPNPGKSITDFKAGQTLEEFYTTYVGAPASTPSLAGPAIKVVSHAEQLALSQCARKSGDRLWCGSCHDPHNKPTHPAAYFRDRCLACHAATLAKAHAAQGRDCVACHMPKLPAKDGGHTAFTNHRIGRYPDASGEGMRQETLAAWREPVPALRERNLALALVAAGLANQSSAEVIRGYRLLNRLEASFPNDPALLAALGAVLMQAKEPAEAWKRFERVLSLTPNYAPYRVNAATALAAMNRPGEAIQQLQHALALDPLLQPAVQSLAKLYREQGEPEKADRLISGFRQAMGAARQ